MLDLATLGERIWVVGCPGSGKTTLARSIAQQLGVPHVELDALYWRAGWRPRVESEFQHEVDRVTETRAWVADGEYDSVRELLYQRSHSVLWLDPGLSTIIFRVFRRGIRNVVQSRELWNGNQETLGRLVSNVLPYAVRMHGPSRRANLKLVERCKGKKPWFRLCRI